MTEKIIFKDHGYDIKVKELVNHISNGLDESFLTLVFSGSDFHIKLANAIRRVCSNNLPMYAFARDLIKIDINTSVAYDNDYMVNRLTNLPVTGVEPVPFFLPEKYWHNVKYADTTRQKHQTEQQFELHVNYHNNSDKIFPVTTNHCNVYLDNEMISPYNAEYPMLLIKLKPNERFKCTMRAVLGTGESHASWDGARNAYYHESDDGKEIILTIEANNQLPEYKIFIKACEFLIYKITVLKDDFEKKLDAKEIQDEKIINLVLERESHTIGELLNYEFQNHPNIIASGVSKPDHLIKTMLIKVTAGANHKSPVISMIESMEIVIKKISQIGKIISDLYKQPKQQKTKK